MNKHAQVLGRMGGRARSNAKKAAARRNAQRRWEMERARKVGVVASEAVGIMDAGGTVGEGGSGTGGTGAEAVGLESVAESAVSEGAACQAVGTGDTVGTEVVEGAEEQAVSVPDSEVEEQEVIVSRGNAKRLAW